MIPSYQNITALCIIVLLIKLQLITPNWVPNSSFYVHFMYILRDLGLLTKTQLNLAVVLLLTDCIEPGHYFEVCSGAGLWYKSKW